VEPRWNDGIHLFLVPAASEDRPEIANHQYPVLDRTKERTRIDVLLARSLSGKAAENRGGGELVSPYRRGCALKRFQNRVLPCAAVTDQDNTDSLRDFLQQQRHVRCEARFEQWPLASPRVSN